MYRPVALALSAALVLGLFLLVAAFSPASAEETVRSISVSGKGEVSAKPDQATVHVGVVSIGKTAKAALEKNNAQMMAVFEAMDALGIEDKNIQTANFSVNPRYTNYKSSNEPPKITDYQVSNSARVTVKDLAELGTILDRLVTVGANQINGVYFGFSDPAALENQARVKAVENARAKASLLAKTAGTTLGKTLFIQEGGASVPGPVMMRMEMAKFDSSVPIATGENSITASVSITYELK